MEEGKTFLTFELLPCEDGVDAGRRREEKGGRGMERSVSVIQWTDDDIHPYYYYCYYYYYY